jgi:hypothetical protein
MTLRRMLIAFRVRAMPRRWPERSICIPSTAPRSPCPRWPFRPLVCENFELLYGFIKLVSVVRIARHAPVVDHHAFREGGGNADFDAKLAGRSDFSLGDAFNLWRVQLVQLALVFGLLRQNAAHAVQHLPGFGLHRLWQLIEFASDFTVHAGYPDSHCVVHLPHALELPGMCLADNLCGPCTAPVGCRL